MKKINCFVATLVGFFAIGLIGCNANKLPTTQYEKVKFAFNGVEKSFKSPKVVKRNKPLLLKRNKIGGSNPSSALDTIFNLYTEEDKRDDFLDDVSYNEPPMIQFQYIKKVLEKIGNGYEFDKKYYDTITGEMYVDINTGAKKEKGDEFKYNYTFTLGMDINIDDNNLITADVSFDINLKKGSESYTTKWYVGIELDYDMANNSPNYTMSMVTENDERELPYYGSYTYEYDYVEVKNSEINEWRKFCMDNDHRLVKDASHQDFNAYVNEGCEYKVDACSWYKNGTYYKNKNVRQKSEAAKTIANALFTNLGLNTNEIDADSFFNKAGTQNSVLKTCYNDFSKIAKEDIIYNLVCRDEQEEQKQEIVAIRAMNADLSGGAGNYQVPGNVTIRELLSGFVDENGEKLAIHLYYIDQNYALVSEITDLVALRFYVRQQDNNEAKEVSLVDSLSDIMERYKFTNRNLIIAFMDEQGIGGVMDFIYSGDLPDTYVKPTFPKVLTDIGVPEYDGERIEYGTQELSKEPYVLEIKNTRYSESQNYKNKLNGNGFVLDGGYLGTFKGTYYRKEAGDRYLWVNYDDSDASLGTVIIRAFHEAKPQQQEDDSINSISMVGDFNDWDVTSGGLMFTKMGDDLFRLTSVYLQPHQAFKFVVNNDWGTRGGYGYSDVLNIAEYGKYLVGGANDNIVVQDQTVFFAVDAVIYEGRITFTISEFEVIAPK